MKQLIHSGVLIPKRYEPKGFHIKISGEQVALTPHQEEMAVAWVKKLGTDCVKDPVFIKNFFHDFSAAMETSDKPLSPEQVDFSEIIAFVEKEKQIKANMSKEEKKKQAQERKVLREANKEKYGCAVIDGVKTEVGNYTVEPPSIFMGRGEHPMRGKWKPYVGEEDIILNLSPDAPRPPSNWKEIIWHPDFMWIAKWDDKLAGKEKYIWLSDSSQAKQEKEIEKFDKAKLLDKKIDKLKEHIFKNLQSEDAKKRKTATVAFLIDELKLRVGDEKDPDEADTVGATTLRPSHVTISSVNKVSFDFLGKDSVRWQREVELPEIVVQNISEFKNEAESKSQLESTVFEGIRSEHVNSFLSQIVPGLTAKVFRTYHATSVVRNSLEKASVSKTETIVTKKHAATMANLDAAIVCNHKRKPPKNWEESLAKKRDRFHSLENSPRKTPKLEERLQALRLKIREVQATRDYNLRTSLKSYIDPRVYYSWGKSVDFDWRLYYPKTLQSKFSWVERKR
ncbi:MAG TPA: DNA topoisomerase I [Candidatus Bathyarchaeia archaeon]|nr:DNA topoisomerase I [Candidatus Bathyarchaeia archaeon]